MPYGPVATCPGQGRDIWWGRCALQPNLLHDLRVQVANHQGGQRSYVVLDVSTGFVHRRAERFLAGFGEGTQRTYAYHLVDHLRWLAVYRYGEHVAALVAVDYLHSRKGVHRPWRPAWGGSSGLDRVWAPPGRAPNVGPPG